MRVETTLHFERLDELRNPFYDFALRPRRYVDVCRRCLGATNKLRAEKKSMRCIPTWTRNCHRKDVVDSNYLPSKCSARRGVCVWLCVSVSAPTRQRCKEAFKWFIVIVFVIMNVSLLDNIRKAANWQTIREHQMSKNRKTLTHSVGKESCATRSEVLILSIPMQTNIYINTYTFWWQRKCHIRYHVARSSMRKSTSFHFPCPVFPDTLSSPRHFSLGRSLRIYRIHWWHVAIANCKQKWQSDFSRGTVDNKSLSRAMKQPREYISAEQCWAEDLVFAFS